jgi:hypothetical protein
MKTYLRAVPVVVLALALSSCGEREAPGLFEPSFAAGGPSGFPHVFVTTHVPRGSNAMAPRVSSLAEAVQLVRAGGTIVVEDGEWETDGVIINKPLTMTRAPQAEPLLVNHNPDGGGLTIDGVAQGTVELRDLRFENAAGLSAVLARGTYDRVVIRDSRVDVTYAAAPNASGRALGINAKTSTIPGGQLIVENTTFVGGRFAVMVQGATAHVRGSRFTESSVASVQYTLGSRGTIEHNEIDGCGSNACIFIFDPDGIDIANNSIRHPVGTARNGIGATTSLPGTWSVVIRDNDLVGTGVQPDDLDPYPEDGDPFGRPWNASALAYGIRVTGTVDATVADNRVSGAHIAISGSGSIVRNRVWDCGGICLHAYQPMSPTVIEDNVVLGDVGFRRTGAGIFARSQELSAPVTIRNNTVTGNRNAGDPSDPLSYAFKIGIQAMSWNPWDANPGPMVTGLPVEVYGNSVTDVGHGVFAVLGGFIIAHDNVLTSVGQGIAAWDALALSRMHANRNDVLNAAVAVAGNWDIDARCNWWGSAAGPGTAWVPPAAYTPWATVPIANRPAVTCP